MKILIETNTKTISTARRRQQHLITAHCSHIVALRSSKLLPTASY